MWMMVKEALWQEPIRIMQSLWVVTLESYMCVFFLTNTYFIRCDIWYAVYVRAWAEYDKMWDCNVMLNSF